MARKPKKNSEATGAELEKSVDVGSNNVVPGRFQFRLDRILELLEKIEVNTRNLPQPGFDISKLI